MSEDEMMLRGKITLLEIENDHLKDKIENLEHFLHLMRQVVEQWAEEDENGESKHRCRTVCDISKTNRT